MTVLGVLIIVISGITIFIITSTLIILSRSVVIADVVTTVGVVIVVASIVIVVIVNLVGIIGNRLLDLLFTFRKRRDDLGGDVVFIFNSGDGSGVGKFVFTESLNFNIVVTVLVNLVHGLIEANNIVFLEDDIVLNSQIESDDTGFITNKTLKELSGITLLVITLF